jgi:hypothetical protein
MNKFYCILTKTPLPLVKLPFLPAPVIIPIDDLQCAFTMDNQKFFDTYKINKPCSTTEIYFRCKSGINAKKAIFTSKQIGFKYSFDFHDTPIKKFL